MKRIVLAALGTLLLTGPACEAGVTQSQIPPQGQILYGQNADGTFSPAKLDNSGNVQTNATAGVATYATTDKGGTVTLGGTAQNAISSNASRKIWCIQNDPAATENLNVRLNGTASATAGIALQAGQQACNMPGFLDTSAVSVFAATTGHRWFGFEGQ